jgi:germacradienol/geosmin synthase
VWDSGRLDAADVALCAAGIHPDADQDALDLSTQWLTWGTYADDYYPTVFDRRHDIAGAKACNERLAQFLPLDGTTTPTPLNALERGLADLWIRTADTMSPADRRMFRASILDMLDSWLWEIANHMAHRVADPVDYVEMRRKTFGSDMTVSLSRLTSLQAVPRQIRKSTPITSLENAAKDYAILLNDIVSYQKEIQFEGELNNAVLVVQQFLNCTKDRAVEVVNNLMTARIQQFEHIVKEELPALSTNFDVEEKTLTTYANHLKNWLAGVTNWHQQVQRYQEPELHRTATKHNLTAPTGIGTQALKARKFLSPTTT